jgi:Radial spoke protein 3
MKKFKREYVKRKEKKSDDEMVRILKVEDKKIEEKDQIS